MLKLDEHHNLNISIATYDENGKPLVLYIEVEQDGYIVEYWNDKYQMSEPYYGDCLVSNDQVIEVHKTWAVGDGGGDTTNKYEKERG